MLDKAQLCGHRQLALIQVSFKFSNLIDQFIQIIIYLSFEGSQQAHEQIQSAGKAQGQPQQPQQPPAQQPQAQQVAGGYAILLPKRNLIKSFHIAYFSNIILVTITTTTLSEQAAVAILETIITLLA